VRASTTFSAFCFGLICQSARDWSTVEKTLLSEPQTVLNSPWNIERLNIRD